MRKALTTTTSNDVDLDLARQTAVDAAQAAGAIIRQGLDGALGARAKDASGDLVTDLDLAAESLIVSRLRAEFPEHRIRSEEAGLLDGDDSWCWLVDPLDGTNNVAIGLRACAVGIALCRDGLPLVGVVHDAVSGRTYSAIRDRGAFGPGGELWCPPFRATESGGVLAWLQGYGVARSDEHARALRLTLERGSRRLVQLWAPLLCWVMLARGDIEGFVGYRAGFVDLPAGSLIAREAGVRIVDFDGAPLDEGRQLDGDVDFVAGPAGAIPDLVVMVKAAQEVTVTGLTG